MSVKVIDRGTVHRICSGQVVLSLAVAVKELVENSLDAGATSVEVRLREQGSELVEVVDNGCGVTEDNFQALTLKHHTSKIADFSDLEVGVNTFGFRGEALSSLCALSELSVTTCHVTSKVGTRLEYDNQGVIQSETPCARQTGTTVSLQNLFQSLPVRRKEFIKNIKREFVKMVQLLQGYCIVSTGVKISCSNQTNKGGKQLVLSTSGNATLKDNITDVFGAKQFSQLVEIVQCSHDDIQRVEGDNIHPPEHTELFKLTGYVSRCNHGYGRGSTDRQFFFFNNRPCDHTKLSKLVNEVYHCYNRHQYPFIVLCVKTDKQHVDVNVTPDKRKVMLHREKVLLLLIKVTLKKLFEPMQGAFDASEVHTPSSTHSADSALSRSTVTPSSLGSLKRFRSSADKTNSEPQAKQAKLFECGVTKHSPNSTISDQESPLLRGSHGGVTSNPTICTSFSDSLKGEIAEKEQSKDDCPSSFLMSVNSNDTQDVVSIDKPVLRTPDGCDIQSKPVMETLDRVEKSETKIENSGNGEQHQDVDMDDVIAGNGSTNLEDCTVVGSTSNHITTKATSNKTPKNTKNIHKNESTIELVTQSTTFDLHMVARRQEASQLLKEAASVRGGRGFRAKITPSSNKEAESELRREIRKSDFARMKVLGQFNLGFIITKLETDLFIVDQHATDEKYNFERLQQETVIEHQKLICPIPLELTAVHENLVIDNLHLFEMNGFHFHIDEHAAPCKRIKLLSKPVCGSRWSLGPKDIDELVFMLSDSGVSEGEVFRPSAVRAYFASKSCRTSVMIGTPLNSREMSKLIQHMGDMEQPWNCPHGRPTFRHLMDLSKLSTDLNDS